MNLRAPWIPNKQASLKSVKDISWPATLYQLPQDKLLACNPLPAPTGQALSNLYQLRLSRAHGAMLTDDPLPTPGSQWHSACSSSKLTPLRNQRVLIACLEFTPVYMGPEAHLPKLDIEILHRCNIKWYVLKITLMQRKWVSGYRATFAWPGVRNAQNEWDSLEMRGTPVQQNTTGKLSQRPFTSSQEHVKYIIAT